jgi:hypothetical protein
MEKILSSLPFDRLCKTMTIFGLILVILPLLYLIPEKIKYQQESIRSDGKNHALSQKEKILKDLLKTTKK